MELGCKPSTLIGSLLALAIGVSAPQTIHAETGDIVHDAEYYILESQLGDQWAQDNAAVDAKLAEFRESNGGKPPNILYILIDDVGFGDIGNSGAERGARNRNPEHQRLFRRRHADGEDVHRALLHAHARRLHDGPPSRSHGHGRYDRGHLGLRAFRPARSHWRKCLKRPGTTRGTFGKWHMGDIAEAWAMNQGFDFAAHPLHQQGQLTIYHDDAIKEQVSVGIADFDEAYTLDDLFRPDASAMATVIEGEAGGPIREGADGAGRTLERREV